MLSTGAIPGIQETKVDQTMKLEDACKKLSNKDISDPIITTIINFLELQVPLNQDIFKFILMSLIHIKDYSENIKKMFESLKKHPDLKNNKDVILSNLSLLLSDVSIVCLHDIYPAHAKLVDELFFLNPELYNNKEFLNRFMPGLMKYNEAADSFMKKIFEYVDFSILSTDDLIHYLIIIPRLARFNEEFLWEKIFTADNKLLEKATPQQLFVLFRYAYNNKYDKLADMASALEFDPNMCYTYSNSSREIESNQGNDSLLYLILKDSDPIRLKKYLRVMMQKGADVFALKKYIKGHPIDLILDNKLLAEIDVYFNHFKDKVINAEKYLIIRALLWGIGNDKNQEYYKTLKESGWLTEGFCIAFEEMTPAGIDLNKVNKLYPGLLEWWLKNLVLNTDKLSYFNCLPVKDFFIFLSQIFFSPELAKQFSPYLARLECILYMVRL